MRTDETGADGRRRRGSPAVGVGVGVTVSLLVAVFVIEALDVAFSAIVGLPVGVAAGTAATAAVTRWGGRLSRGPRAVVDGVASFGPAVLAALGARYVDLPGARAALTVEVVAGGATAVAVAVAVGSWLVRERGE